ncbi:MAG: hypothetical protein LQ351_005459 [Letrouitia transgressa]|nr:MAG: hypothetical protein LQ351_005459 [Letrouitia transgressa]
MGGSVPTIPGVPADQELLMSFRSEVAGLLGRRNTSFPGAQPVSFAAKHMLELQKQDYYVCEKSDGIRCLMYLTRDMDKELIYLIDRKNDYYYVDRLHFPLPGSDESLFHIDTLVDGELVNDREPNGSMQLKYLVFDCLVLDGSSLMHRTLDKRLAYFRDKVFNPYVALYKKYPEEAKDRPFIVDFKNMEFSYGIAKLFKEVLPRLPHGNDGLIFTCRNTPYQFGTDPHILKWKPPKENSIDFILSLEFPMLEPDHEDLEDGFANPYPDYSATPRFNLAVLEREGKYLSYGVMFMEPFEWERMKSLEEPINDRVVECYLDQFGKWRFLRFRDDKKEPNHISTVKSVMESIQDRITEEDLIASAKEIRDEWKRRDMEKSKMMTDSDVRKMSSSQTYLNGDHHDRSSSSKRKIEEPDISPKASDSAFRRNAP